MEKKTLWICEEL